MNTVHMAQLKRSFWPDLFLFARALQFPRPQPRPGSANSSAARAHLGQLSVKNQQLYKYRFKIIRMVYYVAVPYEAKHYAE